ncbi:MAG TPA: MFS transporter [Gemmatimonadales bacterium]|nr:MFS transporter [Gemmatimonadales bacterium]
MTDTAPTSSQAQLRQLGVLIAVNAVDMLGFAMVMPILPFYAQRMGASPLEIGALISSYSIAQLISAPFWGRVSDRYGRRPALVIGLAGSALAYLVFAFSNQLWLLFLSRAIQGAGGGTTGVAQAYVTDTVRPSERAKALGWLSAATGAGIAIGPVISSMSAHLGSQYPGIIAAVICIVNLAFAWYWLPESHTEARRAAAAPNKRPVWQSALDVVQHPGRLVSRMIWIYGVGMLAFTFLTAILPIWLGAEMTMSGRPIDEKNIWPVFMCIAGLSFLIRVTVLGAIIRRFGELGTIRLGCLALITGFILYPFQHSWAGLVPTMAFVPLGAALIFPSTTALMSRFSAKEIVGETMGVAQMFAGAARIIAPLISTYLFGHFTHSTPFFVAAALVVVASFLVLKVDAEAAAQHATPAPV